MSVTYYNIRFDRRACVGKRCEILIEFHVQQDKAGKWVNGSTDERMDAFILGCCLLNANRLAIRRGNGKCHGHVM